jgi:hypothetical protein
MLPKGKTETAQARIDSGLKGVFACGQGGDTFAFVAN